MRGADVTLNLARLCPALSLQQIYRLTEHQHDDWIAGGLLFFWVDGVVWQAGQACLHDRATTRLTNTGLWPSCGPKPSITSPYSTNSALPSLGTGASTTMGSQSIVLLETLRRLMDEQAERAGEGADGLAPTPSEEGDDSLLVRKGGSGAELTAVGAALLIVSLPFLFTYAYLKPVHLPAPPCLKPYLCLPPVGGRARGIYALTQAADRRGALLCASAGAPCHARHAATRTAAASQQHRLAACKRWRCASQLVQQGAASARRQPAPPRHGAR